MSKNSMFGNIAICAMDAYDGYAGSMGSTVVISMPVSGSLANSAKSKSAFMN